MSSKGQEDPGEDLASRVGAESPCSDMKRAAAKKLIGRYFYQLIDGCGNPQCDNQNCASSGKVTNLTPDQAAGQAIQLFAQEARLCDGTQPSKVARTTLEPGPASLAKSLPVKSVNPTCSVEGTQTCHPEKAPQNSNQNPNSTENTLTPNPSNKNASGDDKSNSGKMQIGDEVVDSSLPPKLDIPQFVVNLNSNKNQKTEAQINEPQIEIYSNLNQETSYPRSKRKSERNTKLNANSTKESMKKVKKKTPKRRARSKSNLSEDQDESVEIQFPPKKRARATKTNRNQEASNFAQILESSKVFIPKRKYTRRVKGKKKKYINRKTTRKPTERKKRPYRCRNPGSCAKHRTWRLVPKLLVLALYLRYLDAKRCINSASTI